ncbi:PREDICTED: protein FAM45 homolog [Nicrophorus vespilloides]|uniref:Protein FAM45 homolog n=1 Tax=Nicrophorus vespilloides TaxID=110193 RepID=A0ABM1MB62_NICVS|nr:PREDICTED: protein FAM45 homolog [Nicrophorus vespilloides]
MAISENQLMSFHIIERFHNEKLITWSYPDITQTIRDVLVSDISLQSYFHRTQENEWIYIWESATELKKYSLALVTKSFNPNQFEKLGHLLMKSYEQNLNPVQLVKIYLEAFMKGSYIGQENGNQIKECNRNNYIGIKDLIHSLGHEFILILNALLLKKNVIVYHSNLETLQKNLKSIASLIDFKLRDPTQYLFPIVKKITSDLKDESFYVAGIKDKSVIIKQDHYDLFVNLLNNTITIASKSKDSFCMTSKHKEITMQLVQMVEDNCNDSKLQQTLHRKTENLINSLQTNEVRSCTNSSMDSFMLNLAVAENLMI